MIVDPHGKLSGIHPDLIAKIGQIGSAMNTLGFQMIVTNGLRTVAEQQALYAEGRTVAGKIVTNDDGVVHRSNHQAHPDGFGHAVDCTFLDSDGKPSWDTAYPWQLYGLMGVTLGLVWGGNWTSLVDRPHLELP